MKDIHIDLKPIGVVINNHSDEEVRNSLFGVQGQIFIYDDYKDGLCCLQGFSHIIVIGYAHKLKEEDKKVLKVRLRKIERLYNVQTPEVGVFSSGSPARPNLLIISILKLIDIKDNILYVDNLDMYDKTPILDIRPFTMERIPNEEIKVPEWYAKLFNKIKDK